MTDFSDGSTVDGTAAQDAPQAEGDFMSDLGSVFVDAVESVDLGDDGGLNLIFHQPESSNAAEAPHDSGSAEGADTGTPEGETAGGTQDAVWEQRYKDLQSFSDSRNADLQNQIRDLSATVQNLAAGESPEGEADNEGTLSPEVQDALGSFVQENFDVLLQRQTGMTTTELNQLANDWKVQREINHMVVTYGEEFTSRREDIIQVMQSLPDSNPSFEEALEIVLLFEEQQASDSEGETEQAADGETSVPAEIPHAQPATAPAVDSRRAAALQAANVDSAVVDGGYTQTQEITSTREAMTKALEDLTE
jgi:hypothetical protein